MQLFPVNIKLETLPCAADNCFQLVKETKFRARKSHNSGTINGIITKFKLVLCITVRIM